MPRETFVTTGRRLKRGSPIYRLYEKAKRLGIWNPAEIDLTQDQRDWQAFQPDERDLVLRLCAMFQAGEEAVTLDLLPLIQTVSREGRLEEELYLTTFLFEEAKHTDFFQRFLEEVTGESGDLSRYHTENYRVIFYQLLPEAMQSLTSDGSPVAQARAAVTYNMIAEGVLAETGYYAFYQMLAREDRMPGMRQAIGKIKQDESRHIAYGIFLLSRLVAEHSEVWPVIEEQLNGLLPFAMGVIGDAFALYDPVPFDLRLDDFINYSTRQFDLRYTRLEKSRGATLAQVEAAASEEAEGDTQPGPESADLPLSL